MPLPFMRMPHRCLRMHVCLQTSDSLTPPASRFCERKLPLCFRNRKRVLYLNPVLFRIPTCRPGSGAKPACEAAPGRLSRLQRMARPMPKKQKTENEPYIRDPRPVSCLHAIRGCHTSGPRALCAREEYSGQSQYAKAAACSGTGARWYRRLFRNHHGAGVRMCARRLLVALRALRVHAADDVRRSHGRCAGHIAAVKARLADTGSACPRLCRRPVARRFPRPVGCRTSPDGSITASYGGGRGRNNQLDESD